MPLLSIIIPVLDEADQIPHLITHLSEAPEEIAIDDSSSNEYGRTQQLKPHLSEAPDVIAVDGGSTDGTLVLLSQSHIKVISAARGRSNQMNAGAAVATGDVLLFLHVDTRLPPDYIEELAVFINSGKPWGRFDVQFDDNHPMFRLIASMMNWRSRFTGICTGDQAIFIRRSTFDSLNGFADIPLFEDIELCKRLKSLAWPFCITSPVTTSGRRWRTHGFCKTILLMSWLRLLYYFGVSPAKLSQRYYMPDQGLTDQPT